MCGRHHPHQPGENAHTSFRAAWSGLLKSSWWALQLGGPGRGSRREQFPQPWAEPACRLPALVEVTKVILGKILGCVLGRVAIVENAFYETALFIKAIPPGERSSRRNRLLARGQKSLMPACPTDRLHTASSWRKWKRISVEPGRHQYHRTAARHYSRRAPGNGKPTRASGTFRYLVNFQASHGNATGVGLVDCDPQAGVVWIKIDRKAIAF